MPCLGRKTNSLPSHQHRSSVPRRSSVPLLRLGNAALPAVFRSVCHAGAYACGQHYRAAERGNFDYVVCRQRDPLDAQATRSPSLISNQSFTGKTTSPSHLSQRSRCSLTSPDINSRVVSPKPTPNVTDATGLSTIYIDRVMPRGAVRHGFGIQLCSA
jgi:hypothetical protein